MQNLISLTLSEQDLADLDAAIATLQRVFTPFVALQPSDRIELKKMGPKSREFCEQALTLLDNNRQMVPPNLGLDEALADRTALEHLRPRLQQLHQLVERADDTEMALGSDMMAIALEGYRLLEVSGKGEALKSARRELSTRFARKRRPTDPEPDPAPKPF
ncbi:hypothetical protein H4F99_04915 [Lysobacter sp. SG-8]|uniref:Uncharacterized protein n=1 Tax=Marilutibacter penaei TaxID=2759900 RepID=A0A7W3YDX3_9GAMM|nr:hypothetical protein [Lysobacter penaei]MBB1087828.1 hypothetical protein [Lysobacter penaei]